MTMDKLEFKGFLSFIILHELKHKPLCGDELAEKIGLRRGEKLTPGTIYPTLKLLKKRKYIRYRRNGRKKIYFLREEGIAQLELQYNQFARYFWGLKKEITKKRIMKLKSYTQ